MALQGFGNVGSHAAKFLREADFKLVAISDASGGYYNADGLNVQPACCTTPERITGRWSATTEPRRSPTKQLLELDVELLVPAALGGTITAENAPHIKAPIIIEAANSPIWPDADQIFDERGTVILPDILANAGGVTVSYFEWAQNRQYYQWGLNRVRQELDRVLAESFEGVWELVRSGRSACELPPTCLGIGRVGRATILGGIT